VDVHKVEGRGLAEVDRRVENVIILWTFFMDSLCLTGLLFWSSPGWAGSPKEDHCNNCSVQVGCLGCHSTYSVKALNGYRLPISHRIFTSQIHAVIKMSSNNADILLLLQFEASLQMATSTHKEE